MPLAVAFQGPGLVAGACHPRPLLHDRWHLLLIGLTLLFSVNYLHGGVRRLRRRQDWIAAHAMQERAGS